MSASWIFIVGLVLMMLGVPIGISIGSALLLLVATSGITTYQFIAQYLYSSLSSFTLMALPFFIIAGSIMDGGGLSKRMVNFANSLVGNVTGSLGLVSILACMFFGAVSGSAPATVSAVGAIMLPQMVRNGYDKYYATGLIAVAGSLGVIVPPSYPMVIFGVTNNVSISDLFIAGLGPAVAVGVILMLINYAYCRKYNYRGVQKFELRRVFTSLWDAKWALLMPVIILGGIYSGVFTATEAAVVSVVYGIIIGKFVYRELSFRRILKLYKDNIPQIGGMLFTFAPAGALGAIFSMMGFSNTVNQFFLGISTNPYVIVLLLIYALLFVVGMFVQTTPAIVILSPILLGVAESVGINPVHFGLMMVLALAVAFVTPPVAVNLFVATTMTGISIERIARSAMPFIVGLLIAEIVIGFVPQISMFLL